MTVGNRRSSKVGQEAHRGGHGVRGLHSFQGLCLFLIGVIRNKRGVLVEIAKIWRMCPVEGAKKLINI